MLVLERLGAGYGTDWTDEWIALGLYFALKTSNATRTRTSNPSPRYPQGKGRKTEEKISHETQGDRLNV